MSRNLILVVGALLWSVAILDGLAHFATGASPVTVAMVVAGIAGAALIAVREPGSTDRPRRHLILAPPQGSLLACHAPRPRPVN